jgi:hypothetical protein
MTGPKTFEEWVEAYEERDVKYVPVPGERVAWHSMHGFFTYRFDAKDKELQVLKMCGNGKYWRPVIYELLIKGRDKCGLKGAYCCTGRNIRAFLRTFGGTLRRMEHTYDFTTGKSDILWFVFVTAEQLKEAMG